MPKTSRAKAAPNAPARPLSVVYVAIDDLRPYERNARTHPEAQIAQLVKAIRTYGWTNPILVDDDLGIVAGHGRLEAARRLGMPSVPVIRLGPLTEAQRRALVLADNQIAANAGWDIDVLADEIAALTALDIDLDGLGFGPDEMKSLGLLDQDDVAATALRVDEDDAKPMIVVNCVDERQQAELFDEFQKRGLNVRMMQ